MIARKSLAWGEGMARGGFLFLRDLGSVSLLTVDKDRSIVSVMDNCVKIFRIVSDFGFLFVRQ